MGEAALFRLMLGLIRAQRTCNPVRVMSCMQVGALLFPGEGITRECDLLCVAVAHITILSIPALLARHSTFGRVVVG